MPVMHIFIVVLHDVHMRFQLEPIGADTQNQPCVYGGGGGILSHIYNDTTEIERMHQILDFFHPVTWDI